MILPTIAIIGRPNVGKSTLVNRLCQSNDAIVFDKPGVTRDRTYQNASWGGKEFQIVDTGGLVFDDDSELMPSPSSPPVNPVKGHFGDPEIK